MDIGLLVVCVMLAIPLAVVVHMFWYLSNRNKSICPKCRKSIHFNTSIKSKKLVGYDHTPKTPKIYPAKRLEEGEFYTPDPPEDNGIYDIEFMRKCPNCGYTEIETKQM